MLLRELVAGSSRFNDLRRGIPRMSPALLSQRLKDLEAAGVLDRRPVAGEAGVFDYHLTEAGRELQPLIEGFGYWGQRWIDQELSLQNLDAQLLMWDMRRNLDPTPLPKRRVVVMFQYPEQAAVDRSWWMIVEPDAGVDLCSFDPGFDVDLYVSTDLRTMTAIWMGLDKVQTATSSERMLLTGDRNVAGDMQRWLGLSPFAKERPRRGMALAATG